jgi:hypothetical protein
LAISKKQLEVMGSELLLKSNIGKGSKFYFTVHLPKAKEELITTSPFKNVLHLSPDHQVKALVMDDVKKPGGFIKAFIGYRPLKSLWRRIGKKEWKK